jgi:hypothetical protein
VGPDPAQGNRPPCFTFARSASGHKRRTTRLSVAGAKRASYVRGAGKSGKALVCGDPARKLFTPGKGNPTSAFTLATCASRHKRGLPLGRRRGRTLGDFPGRR